MKKVTKQTYINWYKDMLFWRKFEDKLASVYIQQKVRGFLHLYNGQEAVLAGSLHAMDLSKDKMITAYRNHVQPIGMGEDPKRVMAELYGKVTGTSKGMGGSMHIFSKKHGFYGGHGIVGGQIPLGAGIAFGDKYKGSDGVTLTCFGDGAARQGSLHETFNMAMLWKLPVVFIVENNGYAMGTSVERTANHTDIWKLGLGYEMPCGPVDGMNPIKVAEAVDEAIQRAFESEHGFRHTAVIHSQNVRNMTRMGRLLDTTLFIKNGPSVAGLGLGGEGYLSFSIATPTGEGVTTPLTFTRQRRCTLVDDLRVLGSPQ